MKWLIYNSSDIKQGKLPLSYKEFVDSNSYSGVWHQVEWLDFQLKTNNYQDGFCFLINSDDGIILSGLLLIKRLPFGLSYGYIPGGFLFNELNEETYRFFLKNIKDELKKRKSIYCEIDFIRPRKKRISVILKKGGSYKINKKASIPSYTNQINLSLDNEEILKQMKHKGRYNIKLAKKKGVTVREGRVDEIDAFYTLLLDTTKRDGFRAHSIDYYKMMLTTLPNCKLLIAEHEDDILASGIFIYTNKQALYYYGASSNIKRNLMAPYLLQWSAIQKGKDLQCAYYDFMGIAEPNSKRDRLLGVTNFKLKFGGKIIRFESSYRIILNFPFYLLYKLGRLAKRVI